MQNQTLKKTAIWLAALVAFLLLVLMIWATLQTAQFKTYNQLQTVTGASLLSLAGLGLAGGLAYFLKNKNSLIIFIVIMLLTALKLIFMIRYPATLTSDFWTYDNLAKSVVGGTTWQQMLSAGTLGNNILWPHVLNIAWFFSVFDSFFIPSTITGQVVSIILSGISIFMLYMLLGKFLAKSVAIFAALLFHFIPAFWLYSILNAPESFFLVFLLGSFIFYYDALYTVNKTHTRNYFYLGCSLLLLFLANAIRPIVLVWIVVVLFFSVFSVASERISFRRLLTTTAIFALTFSLLTAVSVPLYRVIYGINFAPATVEQHYFFATGTSVATSGAYNAKIRNETDRILGKKDMALDTRYHQITDRMTAISTANLTAIQRTGPMNFLWKKTINLMSEDYGANWFLYNTAGKTSGAYFNQILPLGVASSVVYFVLLLLLAAASVLWQLVLMLKKSALTHMDINSLFYEVLLLDGFFLSSLIFEVQGRYHIVLYLPIVILIALGGQLIIRQFSRTR
ncbi:glycosyltransferase family 39 protein [Schleiferilactobacillus perolens]|uniref:Integral membrane protein n=1 Tax=Schleiferilactobacillus perolens DSM 12744 TaxID=1423792 RepID=A0A0R1NA47_9LACO|nr:glycosyltransferase family 39 protein [Schleiferilactobacillus perolens]KRL14773.1 integral membrane protein [Schleiferilactobacillus perolens DSM 12744]